MGNMRGGRANGNNTGWHRTSPGRLQDLAQVFFTNEKGRRVLGGDGAAEEALQKVVELRDQLAEFVTARRRGYLALGR
jgi:hypothetical protein